MTPFVSDTLPSDQRATTGAEFERFYAASFPLVVGRVLLIVGDRHLAEDLAQDAMLIILDQWGNRRAQPTDANIAWAIGIAANLSRRHYRRLSVRAKALARWAGQHRDTVVSVDTEAVGRADTYRQIAALPVRLRTVAVLWVLAGMTAEQIGEVLGISPSTVRTYFQRLRKQLGSDGGGQP